MKRDSTGFKNIIKAPISTVGKFFILIGNLLAFIHFHSTACIRLGFRSCNNTLNVRRAEEIKAWMDKKEQSE